MVVDDLGERKQEVESFCYPVNVEENGTILFWARTDAQECQQDDDGSYELGNNHNK